MNSPIWYLRMPEWYGLWITLEALIACAFIVAIIHQKGIVLNVRTYSAVEIKYAVLIGKVIIKPNFLL